MVSIQLDVPNTNQLNRIVDALCVDGGWTSEMGMTKGAFAKQQLATMVKERVAIVEAEVARQAALGGIQVPSPPDIT